MCQEGKSFLSRQLQASDSILNSSHHCFSRLCGQTCSLLQSEVLCLSSKAASDTQYKFS